MKRLVLAMMMLAAVGASQAQYLRAGSETQIGFRSDTDEQNWILAASGDLLSRSAEVVNGDSAGSASFTAGFGVLRSDLRVEAYGVGPIFASAGGTFESSTNFVGAASYDRITFTGDMRGSLAIDYTLHAVNSLSSSGSSVFTRLEVDTFSSTLGHGDPSILEHNEAGEHFGSNRFVIEGDPGQSFELIVELTGLVTASVPTGEAGRVLTRSDASRTATLTITALAGSFSTASGASYAAPVPEPATVSMMLMGLGLLGLGARKLARSRTPDPV